MIMKRMILQFTVVASGASPTFLPTLPTSPIYAYNMPMYVQLLYLGHELHPAMQALLPATTPMT